MEDAREQYLKTLRDSLKRLFMEWLYFQSVDAVYITTHRTEIDTMRMYYYNKALQNRKRHK